MTIYYVNSATGSNTNSGTSPSSPWKLAPGDPNATGNPKTVHLVGGDEVLFKGGVTYFGKIHVPSSGSAGNPIVYEGTGWGGTATISGLSSASLTFTADPSNPSLSVATLPNWMVPKGMPTATESAQANVVKIDGNVMSLSNTSTSTNPNYPDLGQITFPGSQITGSGSTWTLKNPTLSDSLSTLTPSQIANTYIDIYGQVNAEYCMTISGYNSKTGAVSLSGKYVPYSKGFYTLYNDPNIVSSSNPYPEYAIEGNQIISSVAPGSHMVQVSTSTNAFVSNQSNVTFDGFNVSGYGAGDGRAFYLAGGQNVNVTNNTLSNIATHNGYGFGAINANGVSNLIVSGNTVGPNIANGAGIVDELGINDLVSNNTINGTGWTGIVENDDVNSSVVGNRITNEMGIHATGIIAFDCNGVAQQSQNVSITNNQIDGGSSGICIEGNVALASPAVNPDNYTIAYNVITNQTSVGVADWGKTNTASIYGNIVTTTPAAAGALILSPTSEGVSVYDNILQGFPAGIPGQTADTYSDNVSLTPSDANLPMSGGNTANAALCSILQQALASPGVLPASIGSILAPAGGPIGIDFSATMAGALAGAIGRAKSSSSSSVGFLSPAPLFSQSPTLVATSTTGHGGNGGE